ncbi:hypothetical protein [Leifsonia sp. Leaf264]|uniref:hypothetical protein n=1 Tax=Leifsonia sp. Leaf264 TaxID=1736314 RepID=UPI0006FB0611|nr:hypothetical protein [Leifsonia sp. Leaf264]KQO98765.1 hypothetical protein ASF30_11935 [Leifsonia sp. Leaf264]
MRTTPLTFTKTAGVHYAQIDYARLVKARGGVAVVGIEDEDGDVARQAVPIPDGDVIVGFGPSASPTAAGARQLADLGIRSLSTTGAPGFSPAPLEDVTYAVNQAYLFTKVTEGARRVYAFRLGDDGASATAQKASLAELDAQLVEEVYEKHTARFRVGRFSRTPGGRDFTNVAIDVAQAKAVRIAADVCTLLGVSSALGFIHRGDRLSFAYDLASAFEMSDVIPIGFLVGARKFADLADVEAVVDEELHDRRVASRMIEAVSRILA